MRLRSLGGVTTSAAALGRPGAALLRQGCQARPIEPRGARRRASGRRGARGGAFAKEPKTHRKPGHISDWAIWGHISDWSDERARAARACAPERHLPPLPQLLRREGCRDPEVRCPCARAPPAARRCRMPGSRPRYLSHAAASTCACGHPRTRPARRCARPLPNRRQGGERCWDPEPPIPPQLCTPHNCVHHSPGPRGCLGAARGRARGTP